MYVSDAISDIRDVLGRCTDEFLFRRISDAVKLANYSGKFDVSLGQMDICVCDGCVTLPAEVGVILACNNSGFPTLLRDQWYQFHINGSGSQCPEPWGYTDEFGPVSTFRDPSEPVQLVAVVENALDSQCMLRVYGWDATGKRIYTLGANNILEDGILVPTVYGFPVVNPSAPSIARIDRVQKALTNGFVKLIAVDPTTLAPHTTIGYYQPWETNPSYRRIRVSDRTWIRIKYQKKDLEVRAVSDWINIDNREALILLLKSVKFRLDNQIEQAKSYEVEGMRLLSNEAESLRPPGLNAPQVIFADGAMQPWSRDELNLHY